MNERVIDIDVVIVGAGPVGLFQVFELGLLGLKCALVDSMRQPGGQCSELYPDKPIYDIPAIPVCSGQELIDGLMKQIEPFDPRFFLSQEVSELSPNEDGSFDVATSSGTRFHAKAVVIAGGVGSFQPRRLRVPQADELEGIHVHYRVFNPERFADKDVVILGGGDSALDWALELAGKARITLVHRREEYRAVPASVEKLKSLAAGGVLRIVDTARAKFLAVEDGRLTGVSVAGADGEEQHLPCDDLLVFFGLAPKLGPIADWNLETRGKSVPVDTEKFETAVPGIFAVGDINTYPGKKKLILCGFHEAALAAFAIKKRLEPDKKVHLQYTTTSPLMHERLGVDGS